ncbi:MAG: thiamine biosynthesis protein ApbE [Chloroflexi bacterium RBG_13_60_13]|nr:MAG: thiamine biosynthesis protein ApbE [Chloroflexi bacterium RBG_13_60_13]
MHAYQPRSYRHWIKDKDLISFTVAVRESDLFVRATRNLSRKALRVLQRHRASLEGYIAGHPEFLTSLEPVSVGGDAPQIVKSMAEAAGRVGVGPMAAVAGAIAEYVGAELAHFSRDVIVENGGDIFMKITKTRSIGVYAGESSPFTGKIALEVSPAETPLGICTSSGTVGHSLSFGKSDACVVVSRSTPLADAAATAIGNRIRSATDMSAAVDFARSVEGILGVVLIKDDRIGFWGEVKVVPVGG